MTADPHTMRSLLQRATTLHRKADVLLRDIMRELGPDASEDIATARTATLAAANVLTCLQRRHKAMVNTTAVRRPMSPAQSAILNRLRTVGPIPVTGPYPPGTASNRKSLQVQICKLRAMGYAIACEGWHHGGKYAKPGQYRFIEDAA